MSDQMTASDILNKAAELMMEKGHFKGDFFDSATGALCLRGAICLAAKETFGEGDYDFLNTSYEHREALHILARLIAPGQTWAWIGEWNDATDTTAAMAIGALHEAALLAKEQGD